jgi:adenosylmethionine-8-amino-7-oxononanoate aminotransferase
MNEWKVPVMSPKEIDDLRERANRYWWLPTRQSEEEYIRKNVIIVAEGLAEGKGCKIRDAAGKVYLDFTASDWCAATGYGRSEVVQVAVEQMMKIPHVDPFGNLKLSPATINFATKLAQISPGSLNKVFTISGGSEANESAFKVARQYHKHAGKPTKYKIISRRWDYHGATHGALATSGNKVNIGSFLDEPFAPGYIHISHPYCYRCDFDLKYPSCNLQCARQLEKVIQYEHPDTVAAFILDTLAPFAGMSVPPPEYLPMIRETCDKYGVIMILDEVATGFGRTGKMFACEHWNVVPDIMTLDKGISGGWFPLSAVVVKDEIASKFQGGPEFGLVHGHTWWGHSAALATSLRNIEIIERENLVQRSAEMGKYMLDSLQAAIGKSPIVGEVRGLGLAVAAEFVKDRKTKEPLITSMPMHDKVFDKMAARGLFAHAVGSDVVLWPPLIVSKSEIDEAVKIVAKTVREMEKELV